MPDMSQKTVLITGASLGIGKETAIGLAAIGARVVMVARARSRGEAALAEVIRESGSKQVELMLADLASLDDVRTLASDFKRQHTELHLLINNAGAMNAHRTLTKDGFETTFGVNHLAHVLLTDQLLDVLRASAPSRIINVSSTAHVGGHINFDDLQGEKRYSAIRAYGQSKLANVLFTYELARRLEGSGVTANALHPGVVRTGFGKNSPGIVREAFKVFHIIGRPFFISPAEGARTSIYLASSPELEGVTGKYFDKCAQVSSNTESHDTAIARRLWQVSEELTKPAGATAN